MQNPEDLRVWHAAKALALAVIDALPESQAKRVPGIRGQAIRAAQSVPANIAEGCGRSTRVEFAHYLDVAMGSLNELKGHLIVARDSEIIHGTVYDCLERKIKGVGRMLWSFRLSVTHSIALEEDTKRKSQRRPDKE